MIPTSQDQRLKDLTRWNRAGLTRFQYVDGDAATWLEEIRAALIGLYLDGADPQSRLPDLWRVLFGSELLEPRSDPVEEAARIDALNALRVLIETNLKWRDLAAPIPDSKETGRRRNLRLLDQYGSAPRDQGWEIMRAFARAANVLLGHVDAYANEGYLRTATQWDNVRRLAAMVNYQPTPPASATTDIALILEDGAGAVEIDRGLAMKHTPPEGGAPLIFETIAPVKAHPALNAARAIGWNRDERNLTTGTPANWTVPDKTTLAHGDLAVLVDVANGPARATSLQSVVRDEDAGTAVIGFSPVPSGTFTIADTELHVEPVQVLRGLPKTQTNIFLAVLVEGIAQYTVGGLVEFNLAGGVKTFGQVSEVVDGIVKISTAANVSGTVSMAPMTPTIVEERGSIRFVHSPSEISAVFKVPGGFEERTRTGANLIFTNADETVDSGTVIEGAEIFGYRISVPNGVEIGYFHPTGYDIATILEDAPEVIIGTGSAPSKSVRFPGKPPKGMEAGDWFAARADSALKALKVDGVRTTADGFYVQFDDTPPGDPEDTEFHGPMRQMLRIVDHDRGRDEAVVAGGVTLSGLPPEARALIKAGRLVIVDEDQDGVRRAAKATITTVTDVANGVRLGLQSKTNLSGWAAGWTAFRLNTAQVSHGETKGSKTLGSGDAELNRQTFAFDIKAISHVPSTAAESGVVPDIDVAVNEVIWPWRDYGDVTADGEKAYSVTMTETGGLVIHFRQRLASGSNNVRIVRHRIGVGAKGTGVPEFSFAKPMKKNRYVAEIVQPFATAGGADREPVSAVREQAPGRLIANGRAVSLKDFEILAARHASVWQARARQIIEAAAAPRVRITVVPANGGALATIEGDLLDFLKERSLPGTLIELESYQDLPVEIAARIRVDTAAFDKTDVQAAAIAATEAAFTLQKRNIGQTLYIAEIMAEIEHVIGIETVTIQTFAPAPGAPSPKRIAEAGGANAAIVPTARQVARVDSVAIIAEAK